MDDRLRLFIIDGNPPNDLVDYLEDGLYFKHCLWCHASADAPTFPVPREIFVDNDKSQLYQCIKCANILESTYSKPILDTSELIKIAKQEEFPSGAEELYVPRGQIEASRALKAYIDDGELPSAAAMYAGPYGPYSHMCLFCDAQVDWEPGKRESGVFNESWPLEIPTGYSYQGYGGVAKVCDECHLIVHNTGLSLSEHTEAVELCGRCGHTYLVTTAENEVRIKRGTVNQHYCPNCYYQYGNSSGHYDVVHVPHDCEVCDEVFFTDKSCILENSLSLHKPHVYCADCLRLSTRNKEEQIIKLITKNHYIVVKDTKATNKYLVTLFKYNPKTKKMPIRIKTIVVREKLIYDATYKAITLFEQELENPNRVIKQELLM